MKYSLYKIPNNKIDFQVPSLNMYTCTHVHVQYLSISHNAALC